LKAGEIVTVMAINEMTKDFVDSLGTEGDKPDIQPNDGQCQARKFGAMMQHGTFQIEAVFF
jgi:hypothetical protein